MTFTTQLNTTYPLNGYNNNIVEFYQSQAVKAVIRVSCPGFQTIDYEITGYDEKFYFNFIQIFKVLINQMLFADSHNYTNNPYRDSSLFKEVTVRYETFAEQGSSNDAVTHIYKLLKSVVQIDDILTLYRDFLTQKETNRDYVIYDVFAGYPFDLQFYQNENTQSTPLVHIYDGFYECHFFLEGGQGGNVPKGVSRISLINEQGELLHQYTNSNKLVLTEGKESLLSIEPFNAMKKPRIHYHENCQGTYLKWFNVYGGWDYWLFSDKHKVEIASQSKGFVYSHFENIEEASIIDANLGQEVEQQETIIANFLDYRRYSKLLGINYSPKVYKWIPEKEKFVEIKIEMSNSYLADNKQGTIEIKIQNTRQLTQSAW